MKGNYDAFNNSSGKADAGVSGTDYNIANSNNVKRVDTVITKTELHSMPTLSEPNSVVKNYKDGKLSSERYYDQKGNPYLDIDYSDHGNPKMHPDVPHEHRITVKNGRIHRDKRGKKINED